MIKEYLIAIGMSPECDEDEVYNAIYEAVCSVKGAVLWRYEDFGGVTDEIY